MPTRHYSTTDALTTAQKIGINWQTEQFDVEDFRRGMDVELEHGKVDPATNVTNDDPVLTGKIALAHLNESPKYYDDLYTMEECAEKDGWLMCGTTWWLIIALVILLIIIVIVWWGHQVWWPAMKEKIIAMPLL